jgi:ribosomal protein S18 acetylase RimI-like enzyme
MAWCARYIWSTGLGIVETGASPTAISKILRLLFILKTGAQAELLQFVYILNGMSAIRGATPSDRAAVWTILEPTIRAGETYTLPRDMTKEAALAYWFAAGHEVFVAEENGEILGTYFIQANQKGGGDHVANCGYMTAQRATGRGIARAMCAHSLEHAKSRGFRAMQFNFVVASNERAVRLWQSFGFEIAGRLPGAFRHPTAGFVDALVMYRPL